jgi:hypothetical protein
MIPLILGIVAALLALFWYHEYRELKQVMARLEDAEQRAQKAQKKAVDAIDKMHAMANSAMKGAPLVKWVRHEPIPEGADRFLWRLPIDGVIHLFNDHELGSAKIRASLLLPRQEN